MNCREMSAKKIPAIRMEFPSLSGLNINNHQSVGAGKDPASAASGDKRSFPSSSTTTPQQEAERLIERATRLIETVNVSLGELNRAIIEIASFLRTNRSSSQVRGITMNMLRNTLELLTQRQLELDPGATQPEQDLFSDNTESESEMDGPQPAQPAEPPAPIPEVPVPPVPPPPPIPIPRTDTPSSPLSPGGTILEPGNTQLDTPLRDESQNESQMDDDSGGGGDGSGSSSLPPLDSPRRYEPDYADDGMGPEGQGWNSSQFTPPSESGGASESQNPIPVPDDESMGGGGESQVLASQYADFIDGQTIEEEEQQQPPQPPGPLQLSQMVIDDQQVGGMRRANRLRRFKADVVAVLREHAASTGPLTSSLRKQMQRLFDELQPFRKKAVVADLMARALERVLEVDAPSSSSPAAAAAGPSSSTTNPPRNRFQKRIVGRATDVVNATKRHSFLLETASNKFEWRDEAYMRRNQETDAILSVYLATNQLVDPSGNGWVKEIVNAVGAAALRIYIVKWTIDADVEPSVPEQLAQEDLLKSQLVPGAQRLAEAFDKKEEDADLEELDASGADGNVLQWDPGSGRPKLSLRRAVAAHVQDPQDPLWTVQALKEYTLNRIIALQSYLPPPIGDPNAPTQEQLDKLGEDLYTINSKALDAAFERQRVLERREAGETSDEPAASKAAALVQWRRERKVELRDETIARWDRRRQKTQPELDMLNRYLNALKLVEAAGGLPANVDTTALTNQVDVLLITDWQTKGVAWPGKLADPPCRLPRIRNFLSTPGRSEEAKGWLRLQRDAHSEAPDKANYVFGSAYGPSWPANPTATNTPPDHVVPQRWFEGGTKLILECGDPGQLPAVALCKLAENSAKGDSALMLFSNSDDVEAASSGQGAYSPTDVSETKKRMLAKHAAWVWALYPLISDQKRSIGITSYDNSTGCAWWSRAWQSGPFQSQIDAPASGFEKRIHLLTLGIRSWRVANPMVFNPGYMTQDVKDYIGSRLSGMDALPKLVDSALRRSVARAPT